MTKKHFIAVAKAFDAERRLQESMAVDTSARAVTDRLAHALSDIFASANPLFDAGRFLTAAGVEE